MFDNLSRVIDVDINDILPNRFQPRIQFDEEEILELSDSIKEHGVIQPLVVRQIGDKYEIIAGERRYKASVLAGKETVPVIVKNLNDKDSAEIALIENIQRKNLTPIEEALSIKKILDMGYITQENLAIKLGKSQSTIANKLRLLNLPDEVQEALLENKISERHARSLLKLNSSEEQKKMLNRIITERLTVRKTDEEIEKINNGENNINVSNIEEKGEMNMNENNMFGVPSEPQNQQMTSPSFDIFKTDTAPLASNASQEMPSTNFGFDIFGGANTTPTVQEPNIMPSTPVGMQQTTPSVGSNIPVMDTFNGTQGINNNVNFNPTQSMQTNIATPEMPTMSSISSSPLPQTPLPSMDQVPSAPEMSSIPSQTPSAQMPPLTPPPISGIDINTNLGSAASIPTQNTNLEVTNQVGPTPEFSTIPAQTIPPMSPIVETPVVDSNTEMTQESENLFSFSDTNPNTSPQDTLETPQAPSEPGFKMPDPIIVTDYSKQYDPVMPTQMPVSKVDFKEVISAIRECSSKIEQYGYKIDVEEYDLSNLYQVVLKIEK